MELLDVHTHLLGKKIFRQLEEKRKDWLEKGVKHVVSVSTTLHESKNALNFFKGFSEVEIGIGKHPWKVKNVNEDEKQEFELLIANKDCKVIGEVGLDYYAVKDPTRYEYQQSWFKFFIDMSNKYKKPLNVHVTGAEKDIYDLLNKYWNRQSNVNVHWYSGPSDVLKGLIELGCYFSINPAIHYSQGHQNSLSIVPLEKLMTESDGDVFYKPLNLLGEPSVVPFVLDKICELKNLEKDDLAKNIILNFKNYMQY